MMGRNRFGIPKEVFSKLRSRDANCVYCGKRMIYPFVVNKRKDCVTIEHLNFDGPFHWSDGLQEVDIVLCCGSCNSSRGIKKLNDWFETSYCMEKKINSRTVAAPVRKYLLRNKRQK